MEAISGYGLQQDQREKIEKAILANINPEHAVKPLKDKLKEMVIAATDGLTEYIKDEYQFVIEDLVNDRAKRLIEALLRGDLEVAAWLGLVSYNINDKEVEYDNEGVRKAIFDKFCDAITHAQWIRLRNENESLQQRLESALARR